MQTCHERSIFSHTSFNHFPILSLEHFLSDTVQPKRDHAHTNTLPIYSLPFAPFHVFSLSRDHRNARTGLLVHLLGVLHRPAPRLHRCLKAQTKAKSEANAVGEGSVRNLCLSPWLVWLVGLIVPLICKTFAETCHSRRFWMLLPGMIVTYSHIPPSKLAELQTSGVVKSWTLLMNRRENTSWLLEVPAVLSTSL